MEADMLSAPTSHQKGCPPLGTQDLGMQAKAKPMKGPHRAPTKWVLPLLKTTREEGLPSSYLGGAAMSFSQWLPLSSCGSSFTSAFLLSPSTVLPGTA